MARKNTYLSYIEMVPYFQPGSLRDAYEKESKKFNAKTLKPNNIAANTTPKSFKQIDSDKLKALNQAQKAVGESTKEAVMAYKAQISANNVIIKEISATMGVTRQDTIRLNMRANQQRFSNASKLDSQHTNELARRSTHSTDEKIREATEKSAIGVKNALDKLIIAVNKNVQLDEVRLKYLRDAEDIAIGKSKAISEIHLEEFETKRSSRAADKEKAAEEKQRKDAAKSLARQKDKELNKYNGMSLPGIANKLLSEKIQTSLTTGLGKIFTGSQGTALSGALGKSIISGVSTAAAGAIVAAVAAGAAALVALMVAPFKLILSFSQKAFNFLKGVATQTETFKKLMELVMMPFMIMFTLLFAPVLMALAPILTSVIQAIVAKQDAIMAVGAKIAIVIEKLFNEQMIETYIKLIDQVVTAIDWFIGVVNDNLTIGNSIFETIVDTFAKVMSEVLVAVVDWAYSPDGQAIIKDLSYLIGTMIGMVAGFVMTMLPALFTALEPSLKGIFKGVVVFFGDLILASFADMFDLDSSVITTMKKYLEFIADFFSIIMGFALNPYGSWMSARDNMNKLSESFKDLLASTQQINQTTSISKVSNVDNTHIDFGQNFGANASSAIDAALVSMRMNGVI